MVTRKQAEKVLSAVKKMFPRDADLFTLYSHEHEELPKGSWSIAAEGVYEPVLDCWPSRVLELKYQLSIEERKRVFADVFLEPVASWCLGIHPRD